MAAGVLACGSASAADVFKCTVDGKTVYADKPCASSAKAVAIAPNSVGEIDQAKARSEREATDKRINGRIAANAETRAKDDVAAARANARCQGYVDKAYREAAWLHSISPAVQQSASTEIALQRRNFERENCGKWP